MTDDGVLAWVDGLVLPAAQARVNVLDSGLTVGDGLFETLRVRDGVALALSRHLTRLHQAAQSLGLAIPPADELRRAVDELLLAARPQKSQRLRITVTGGPSPLGPWRGAGPATLVVAVAPLGPGPEAVDVVTVPWVRNERSPIAGLKSVSYAESSRILVAARERGASEALLANTRGELCEAATSNVFVMLAGELVTPPLTSGCLPGVTRGLVLETSGAVEEPIAYAAAGAVQEAFLTSALRGVTPISSIDGRPLRAPGSLTRSASDALAALLESSPDP